MDKVTRFSTKRFSQKWGKRIGLPVFIIKFILPMLWKSLWPLWRYILCLRGICYTSKHLMSIIYSEWMCFCKHPIEEAIGFAARTKFFAPFGISFRTKFWNNFWLWLKSIIYCSVTDIGILSYFFISNDDRLFLF